MKRLIERHALGLVWRTAIALLGPEVGKAYVLAGVSPQSAMNHALRVLAN